MSKTKSAEAPETKLISCSFYAAEIPIIAAIESDFLSGSRFTSPSLHKFAARLVCEEGYADHVVKEVNDNPWSWPSPGAVSSENGTVNVGHSITARLLASANAAVAEAGLMIPGRSKCTVGAFRAFMRIKALGRPTFESIAEAAGRLREAGLSQEHTPANTVADLESLPSIDPADLSESLATKQDVADLMAAIERHSKLITDMQASIFHLPERTVSAMDHATSGEGDR